jgi:predicted transposase YbfD/YdcC
MNGTFLKHFNSITDPRTERCKKHEIIDILLLAISAVLSGAKGWEDIEDFGHLKLNWLKNMVLILSLLMENSTSFVYRKSALHTVSAWSSQNH